MRSNIKNNQTKPKRQIYAVDLFCGAGGLTHGLMDAGIKVRAGIDLDPICQYPYEHNNNGATFLEKSVTDLEPKEISDFYRKGCLTLLAGCAPCQTFSTYNLKERSKKEKDQNQKTYRRRIRQLYNGVKGRSPARRRQKVAKIKNISPTGFLPVGESFCYFKNRLRLFSASSIIILVITNTKGQCYGRNQGS